MLTGIVFAGVKTLKARYKIGGIGTIDIPTLGMVPVVDVPVGGKDLVELLSRLRIGATRPKRGDGTLKKPFELSTPKEWIYAACAKPSGTETWFRIGGRLIRRWSENQYVSDWGTDTEAIGEKRKRDESMFSDEHGPTYPQIYLGLVDEKLLVYGAGSSTADRLMAAQMLALLAGAQEMKLVESRVLPVLCAAWFLAEVSRNPRSFIVGLMTLDLLQAGVAIYPDGLRGFSFMEALWHPSKFLMSPKGLKIETLIGSKDPDRWGGLHPMAHEGSYLEMGSESWKGVPNTVQLKEADIALHWLLWKLPPKSGYWQGITSWIGEELVQAKTEPIELLALSGFNQYKKNLAILEQRPDSKSANKAVRKKAPIFFAKEFVQKHITPLILLRLQRIGKNG